MSEWTKKQTKINKTGWALKQTKIKKKDWIGMEADEDKKRQDGHKIGRI